MNPLFGFVISIGVASGIVLQLPMKGTLSNHTMSRSERLDIILREEEERSLSDSVYRCKKCQSPRDASVPTRATEPIRSQYDLTYMVTLAAGTPSQHFTVVVDTGSRLAWVVSEECKSQECDGYPTSLHTKQKYKFRQSSTFTNLTTSFSYVYSTGTLRGYYAEDSMELSGIIVDKQRFGLATEIDSVLAKTPADGIIGLAPPGDQTPVPFLKNILPQLTSPVFSIFLARHSPAQITENGGVLTLGGIDHLNCNSAAVDYFPLTSSSHWQFSIDGVSMGSYSNNIKVEAVSDSGTSTIAGPRDDILEIAEQSGANYSTDRKMFTVDCDSEIPDIKFTVGGKVWSVPSKQFVINGGGKECLLALTEHKKGGPNQPSWLMGQPFIRQFCQIYDVGKKRLGFAQLL